MLRALKNWLFGTSAPAEVEGERRPALLHGPFSTHARESAQQVAAAMGERLRRAAPVATGQTADSANGLASKLSMVDGAPVSDAVFSWYASQSFIGYQACAFLGQNWLIEKACAMPGRDALRKGYTLALDGAPSDDIRADALKRLTKAAKTHRVVPALQEWVRFGRLFGIRIAIFEVESTDATYYEKPFNLDAVTPRSFKGLTQVDPYWCTPQFNALAVSDPTARDFYNPTWWVINGKKYHRTHLAIFRTAEPADTLKPMYLYGGIPVAQRILERVYAAERTANEAPQLAMTKRTMVWNTNVGEMLANQSHFLEHMANFVALRDNYGVKINDIDDQMQQFDTSLADLDSVIMTQYQLVAAGANVPATKLLGTTPKGFNATGEYEEANYHEELETIQENDLSPFLDRYHDLVLRSEVEPGLGLAAGTLHATVQWNPLDSMTAEEEATVNKTKAERDEILVGLGAIDGQDVRDRLRVEKDSDYTGLADAPLALADPLDQAIADLQAAGGGDPLDQAIAALGGLTPRDTGLELDQVIAALTGDGFDIPRAAGIVIFRDNGDVLFLRRGDGGDEPNRWAFPGGTIEPGERPQDAAARETFEETGLTFAPDSLVAVGLTDGFVTFAAHMTGPATVTLNHEHTDFAWRPITDAPRPLHRGVRAFLQA